MHTLVTLVFTGGCVHLRTLTVVVRARGHISCSLIASVERHREKFVLKLFGVEVSSSI